ncbi:disulfide isomerase [Acidithiobacillus marinus]|uniref:Disulfide isomerase n=1 Tax=Acidithiobacillus marinus TaxID=187490 RepID=A0A2I1DNR3_9PROT|nr:thioredoxin fold domain-containing protein [Acidithiobacillus marinus]PKY11507.1 disulfide isomerase [Acidithiobacillus marinus]
MKMFPARTLISWLVVSLGVGSLLLLWTNLAEAKVSTPTSSTATAAKQLWNNVLPQRLTYIQEGHHGPILYDFQDPNCPYCHIMYAHEAPLIKAGKLTVRYVPVAILTPQSPEEAAAWLQSADPESALKHFEHMVGPALRTGNYAKLPKAEPTAITRKELKANLQMMTALGFDGTPAMLYESKNDQIGRIPGMISEKELAELLPQLQKRAP